MILFVDKEVTVSVDEAIFTPSAIFNQLLSEVLPLFGKEIAQADFFAVVEEDLCIDISPVDLI